MNIIFFGTPEFAVPALEALIAAGYSISAVVTLPDSAKGRGLNLTSSPVKIAALKHKLLVLEPKKLSDPEFLKKLSGLTWDLGVIAAYGKLIPESILQIPKNGFLNIHPSLLPELRGPSPIQYAILEGKKKTGVSIMLLDKEMDHGPILLQQEEVISPDDTAETLGHRLSVLGATLLVQAIDRWQKKTIQPKEQDHSKATFSKMIVKEDGHIDWKKSADEIDRLIRAFTPWPGAYTFCEHKGKKIRLKIVAAEIANIGSDQPGLVFSNADDMLIAAGSGSLQITHIQPEGKKNMTGKEFLNGYKSIIGSKLS